MKSKDGRFLKLTTRNRRLVCGSAPLVARIRRPSSEFFPVRQRRVRFDGDPLPAYRSHPSVDASKASTADEQRSLVAKTVLILNTLERWIGRGGVIALALVAVVGVIAFMRWRRAAES